MMRRWEVRCPFAPPRGLMLVTAGVISMALLGRSDAAAGSEGENSCQVCHSNPDFLVQNKKLYDYYQEWRTSIHQQEDVSCEDCHGGDPSNFEKDAAHGEGVGASNPASGVYYKNIPETCGTCHTDIVDGFRESHHFQHLEIVADVGQGPSCVTCHGSINSEILNVNSVSAACARCHNEETENHPELPEQAREILNRFLSIHRFYRYITIHSEPEEAKAFFSKVDSDLDHLSVTWHTFALEEIDRETMEVLATMKAKRDELRARKKAAE